MPRQRTISLLSTVVLLVSILLLAACSALVAQKPTPPALAHYTPRPGSLFKIEFDYPASWSFHGDRLDGDGVSSSMSTAESSEFVEPTLPPISFPNPFEKGYVVLSVEQVDPENFSIDPDVESFLDTTKGDNPYNELVNDSTIDIDGYPARHIVMKAPPVIAVGQTMTISSDNIFMLVKDRFYQIGLQIPESKRQSAFAQGFDYLVSSIRVIR